MHNPPPPRHRCWVYWDHLGAAQVAILLLMGWKLPTATACAALWGFSGSKKWEPQAWRVTGSAVTQVAAGPAAFQASGMGSQGGEGPSAALCQPSALARVAVLGGSQPGMGPSAPSGALLGKPELGSQGPGRVQGGINTAVLQFHPRGCGHA